MTQAGAVLHRGRYHEDRNWRLECLFVESKVQLERYGKACTQHCTRALTFRVTHKSCQPSFHVVSHYVVID